MARRAIHANQAEAPGYANQHLCIEPYQMPGIERGDVFFTESSDVIRPQGDVLFEYLELLPTLHPGEIVHVHDICSPSDYLRRWLIDEVWLQNAQY